MQHEIYIDESCQNGHKFMVLGGIVIEHQYIPIIINSFKQVRQKRNLERELKWGKVSQNKLECYKAYLDIFFHYMGKGIIEFHSILIDCNQINHKKYNQGNAELGFSKFTYQLLLRIGKVCRTYPAIHAYLDNRSSNQSLDELRRIANSGIAKKHNLNHQPFKRVQYIDSKNCEFVQVVDLLIGAIGYQSNAKDIASNSSKPRLELLEYICKNTSVKRLDNGTQYGKRGFTIWRMDLSR